MCLLCQTCPDISHTLTVFPTLRQHTATASRLHIVINASCLLCSLVVNLLTTSHVRNTLLSPPPPPPPRPLTRSLFEKFPWAAQDLCLYSQAVQLLSKYRYSFSHRRYVQEMFRSCDFDDVSPHCSGMHVCAGVDIVCASVRTYVCVSRSSSHSGGNHTQCSLCGSHTLGILCPTCCNWSSTVRTYIQQRVGYLCSDLNAVDSHFTAISVHARWSASKCYYQ